MAKESKNKEKKVTNKKSFFKSTKAELKKVIWPNFKQLSNNTVAVISIVIIIGLIVFLLDLGFKTLTSLGIEGLKSAIGSNSTVSQQSDENATQIDEIVSDIQANIDAQAADDITEVPEAETVEAEEVNPGE